MVLGGVAAGMVLFIVSVGLSVTMGLMGFVNLAHGAFAMLGGYAIALAMKHWGFGFPTALVFFTIPSVTLLVGPENQPLALPAYLRGQINLGIIHYRAYSVALIVVGLAIVGALWLGFQRTRLGAQIRAAVDNRRMAESLGINIARLFTITFAFGSGMAALGGGLGAEFLGLDPQYPLKYLVMFLIVVAVGGLGRITGVFYAALIIGVLDFTLKKYLPQGGTVFIYAMTILLLLWRPQGLFGRAA